MEAYSAPHILMLDLKGMWGRSRGTGHVEEEEKTEMGEEEVEEREADKREGWEDGR
jgi:hypothetical protein